MKNQHLLRNVPPVIRTRVFAAVAILRRLRGTRIKSGEDLTGNVNLEGQDSIVKEVPRVL
jgi:hypothetical protein